jgi:hypothetical protein
MNNYQEQLLLEAFRNITDQIDREYIIAVTQRRAAARVARKPILRLVVTSPLRTQPDLLSKLG